LRQSYGGHAEAGGRTQRQTEYNDPHVTLPMIAGGSATGLSGTGACIVHVMADDGVTVRPIGAIVQGIWTFILDHIALLNPL
jgi:hypothetical protein